jgi:transposase
LLRNLQDRGVFEGVLIMDNVAFHKAREVRLVVELSSFKLLYLPPYSPFLNPKENLLSKWKEIVKRAAPKNEFELMDEITRACTRKTTRTVRDIIEKCSVIYQNVLKMKTLMINF